MILFLQQAINGIALGTIYALVALGYQLIFGVLKVLNLAHGDILMFGMYFGFLSVTYLGGNFGFALIMSLFGAALIGVLMQKTTIQPLKPIEKGGSLYAPMIATVGFSLILQNSALGIFGAEPNYFPSLIKIPPIHLGQLTFPLLQAVIFVFCIGLMIALKFLVQRTKIGRAMRATAESQEIASALGVNVSNIMAVTIALASALAGVAGLLYGMSYHRLTPLIGAGIGLRGLVILVVGGEGRMEGALVGGILLGLAETFTSAYISASYRDAVAFGLLILIIMFRPKGLFKSIGVE